MSWDLCMQTGHQTQAYRLVQYFAVSSLRRRIFPGAYFAKDAAELGPHSEHHGPCMVIFHGLELPPETVLAWFNETLHIRRHVTRLYWLPATSSCNTEDTIRQAGHAHEVAVADCAAAAHSLCDCSTDDRCNADYGPAFCTVTAHIATRQALLEDIVAAGPLPGSVLRLYCNPRSLEKFLADQLPDNFQLHPQNFTHVLQAVEADGWLRWSVVPAAWLYRQSTDEAKALPDSVAHAVNKLDEALHVTGLKLAGRLGAAIDIGAAPGAWSMYLAGLSGLVIAVDPAQLHPYALKDNIRHVCKKAEDAVPEIQQLLGDTQADILTCDMNVHPVAASKAIHSLLPLLKPGGVVILTLKFTGTGRDRCKTGNTLKQLYAGVLEGGP